MATPLRLVAREAFSVRGAVSDVQSFEGFFDAESRTLFRRLCLITGNRHEAEDAMQEAFLGVFERWERVQAMEDPVGYLYRTAFNVLHRRGRRASLALRRTVGMPRGVDEFEAADHRDVVSRALATLSRRQRAALVLTELLGYGAREAGEMMGIRAVTVRALASQGRAAMRRMLEHTDE